MKYKRNKIQYTNICTDFISVARREYSKKRGEYPTMGYGSPTLPHSGRILWRARRDLNQYLLDFIECFLLQLNELGGDYTCMKRAMVYFKKHAAYNSTVHAIGGIGIGILISSPVAGIHPIRWGIALLIISLLGHVYAWFA